MQMSTTHSSFNQYHALVTELSHRAAVASGPDVRRECLTKFPALPLLVTNPGDTTACETLIVLLTCVCVYV